MGVQCAMRNQISTQPIDSDTTFAKDFNPLKHKVDVKILESSITISKKNSTPPLQRSVA
jgi:hypothetical protein